MEIAMCEMYFFASQTGKKGQKTVIGVISEGILCNFYNNDFFSCVISKFDSGGN
jgi:hypothetical protein